MGQATLVVALLQRANALGKVEIGAIGGCVVAKYIIGKAIRQLAHMQVGVGGQCCLCAFGVCRKGKQGESKDKEVFFHFRKGVLSLFYIGLCPARKPSQGRPQSCGACREWWVGL